MKFMILSVASLVVAGCVTTDRARLIPQQGQQAHVRNGLEGVSSVGPNTIVLLRRVGRDIPQGQRVGFVVGIKNRGAAPKTFRVDEVEVVQELPGGRQHRIAVLTHEQLVREERARQVAVAILVGVAAGANAAAAANAGHWRANTFINTPRGTFVATTTGYSPAAAAIAQANVTTQNAMLVSQAIDQGHANLARLESEYIKDHTVMPGEWYGGLLAIESPVHDGAASTKTYELRVRIGADVHRFSIVQEPTQR